MSSFPATGCPAPSPCLSHVLSGHPPGPTYWFPPSLPVRRYLQRLADLDGKPAVTIITRQGAGGRSLPVLERRVQKAKGRLVKSLVLHRMRRNDDNAYVHSTQSEELAMEMASRAAGALATSPWGRSTQSSGGMDIRKRDGDEQRIYCT